MARLFDDASGEYLQGSWTDCGYPMAMVCLYYQDTVGRDTAIGVGDADGNFVRMMQINASTCRAYEYAFAVGEAIATSSRTLNTWEHAAALFVSATDRRILMNAGSKGTNALNRDTSGGSIDEINIAMSSGVRSGSDHWSGSIAEVAIYDLSVWPGATDSDKADNFEAVALPALAAGYSPPHIPLGLIAYWPLIRDEDQDRIGGYDLTAYNTPSVADHPPVIYKAAPFLGLGTGTGAVSVTLDALTLAGSVPGLSVSPGAVAVVLQALTLAGSAPALSVSPGVVAVVLQALTLAGSAPSLSVSPGAVAVVLQALTLAGSVPGLSVSPGAVAVVLQALTLAGSVPGLSVSPGAVAVVLQALTLAGSAVGLSVSPGAVAVALAALTLAGSVPGLSVSSGLVVALQALTLAGSVPGLSVSPGAVAVVLNALTLAGSVPGLSIAAVVLSLLRTWEVPAEDRTWAIDAEARSWTVPAEAREFDIEVG